MKILTKDFLMKNSTPPPQNKKTGTQTQSTQGQINQIGKKGKTLGSQHASHGDSGVEKGKLKLVK